MHVPVRRLEASPVKYVLACFQLNVLRPCALCQLHHLCSRSRSVQANRLTHSLHHVLLHVWLLQSLAGTHSASLALRIPSRSSSIFYATSCGYKCINQCCLLICQLACCHVHLVCLVALLLGSITPPVIPPFTTCSRISVSTHIGLTASACAVASHARCAGRLGRRCLLAYRAHSPPIGRPWAIPLRPLGPHNDSPHGSAGPARAGLHCLTTNAQNPPAPWLTPRGQGAAVQWLSYTLICALTSAPLASCSARRLPRATLRRAVVKHKPTLRVCA